MRASVLVSSCLAAAIAGAADLSDLTYTESATAVTISDCKTEAAGTLVIPDSINGKPVTGIGAAAFSACADLTSITLPSGVTTIGNAGFSGCADLETIVIPTGVTSIGAEAFLDCWSLTEVTIPPGLTTISASAFSNCRSLMTVSVPSNVTSIGDSAFAGCVSLTTISLSPNITSIGNSAFSACSSFASITLPPGLTSIGSSTFNGCSGLVTIALPPGITSIGSSAFARCVSLEAIAFPQALAVIGTLAFSDCRVLTTVSVPEFVTSIGAGAFRRCNQLREIQVHPSNPVYADISGILINKTGTILHQCPGGAPAATIPAGVRTIADSAFNGCGKLVAITIPATVTSLGNSAFESCAKLKTFLFLGDAPALGTTPFTLSTTTTAYHLAGKSGWTSTLGGLSTDIVGLPEIATGLSDVVTPLGGSASFQIAVAPTYPLACHFQWQKNGVDIPGATLPALELAGVQATDAAVYTVLVTSDVGTVSDQATLSIGAGGLYTQAEYDTAVAAARQEGIDEVLEEPNAYELYTADQVHALHIGTPLLQRDASTGQFVLTIEALKSTDLGSFSPLSFDDGEVTISPEGELLFRFTSGEGAAFFRVDAR